MYVPIFIVYSDAYLYSMTHIFKRANRPCRSEDILFIISVYVVHLDRKPGYDLPCIVKSKLKKKNQITYICKILWVC